MPLIWGRVVLSAPNVVWYGDLFQEPITERVKTGLFSSERAVIGFRYHVGVQMALCRGPIDGLRRVWIGEDLVFDGFTTGPTFDIDEPTLYVQDPGGRENGIQTTVELYLGTQGQAVSDYLGRFQDSIVGTTRTPNYTGTCHVVTRELGGSALFGRGAYIGNDTTVRPWKFEMERYPALFAGQTSGENKVGVDANPMNVIYELLTNTEWGFGYPAADIDTGAASSFLSASDTLISESNGFSMILDSKRDADTMIKEVLRQVDGVLFLNHTTGKWTIKLARADYDIDLVPQLDETNVKEVKDFGRGSWEDTTNQITVRFNHRDNDYKESFALAQDMANAMIQGGGTVSSGRVVSAEVHYPGVKTPALAAQIAWRDLRVQAYPLAKMGLIVNREFWQLTVGSVVAWTDAKFGFTKLPLRIVSIDYGRLQQNEIELTVVQDIFQNLDASYGFPPTTGWLPPFTDLVAFPAEQQVAFEAPRKFLELDPQRENVDSEWVAKVFASARRQGNEAAFRLLQRHHPTLPAGAFADSGIIYAFQLIGELAGDLGDGVANPTASITLDATPDSQAQLEAAFDDGATPADLGQSLQHLILVGEEFMLVSSASISGSDVLLEDVYRGVLDSVQEAHSAGDEVYLLFVGGGLGTDNYGVLADIVEVELRPRNISDTFIGSVTPIQMQFDFRSAKPYPPAAVLYDGSTPFGTPDLESAGAGPNTFRVDVEWWRRDYLNADEITALQVDQAPSQTTEYQLEVRADPDGANTLVGTVSAWVTGAGPLQVLRNDVITAAEVGEELRFIIRTRHEVSSPLNIFVGNVTEARYEFTHTVIPTSDLIGQFYLGGGVNDNTATASYTAAATGTFTVILGAADAADIEVSLNGGGFAQVIAAGLTSGTFGATSGDGIRFRRLTGGSPDPNFIGLQDPSAVDVAYGTFD